MKMKKLWLSPHLKSLLPHVGNGYKVDNAGVKYGCIIRILEKILEILYYNLAKSGVRKHSKK
jgi:hypothetical protein